MRVILPWLFENLQQKRTKIIGIIISFNHYHETIGTHVYNLNSVAHPGELKSLNQPTTPGDGASNAFKKRLNEEKLFWHFLSFTNAKMNSRVYG